VRCAGLRPSQNRGGDGGNGAEAPEYAVYRLAPPPGMNRTQRSIYWITLLASLGLLAGWILAANL
jgi:hypothetical protein